MLKWALFILLITSQFIAEAQPANNCLVYSVNNHSFPLHAVTGTNTRIVIRDTFLVYNACADTVYVHRLYGDDSSLFRINKVLPPLKETALYFEGSIYNRGDFFWYQTFGISLEMTNKTSQRFSLQIPVTGGNSKVTFQQNGQVSYTIAYNPASRFSPAIMTRADGSIRAKGMVQDGDTSLKMGKWEFYSKEKWQLDTIAYTKELTLAALNQKPVATQYDGRPFSFKVKVRENKEWKEPISEWTAGGLRIFYTAATDSLVAYADSTSYSWPVSYSQMPTAAAMQFYLLKPGEPVLKVGDYITPFFLVKNTYTLLLNLPVNGNYQQLEADIDSFYQRLFRKYPGLAQVIVGRKQKGLYTGSLTSKDKAQLWRELMTDNRVRFICQLYAITDQQHQGYCNNQVYVKLNGYNMEALKQLAAANGFTDIRADGFSSHHYLLTYKSKLVDGDFFTAFSKLANNPLVAAAYFNSYSEAEPDEQLQRPAKMQD